MDAAGTLPFFEVMDSDLHKEFDAKLMQLIIRQSNFDRRQFYGATKSSARRAGVPLYVVS